MNKRELVKTIHIGGGGPKPADRKPGEDGN